MLIINALKIMINNLGLVGKLIVYYAFVVAIGLVFYFSLIAPVAAPLVRELLSTGVLENLRKVVTHYIGVSDQLVVSVEAFNRSVAEMGDIFSANASRFALSFALLGLTALVVQFLVSLKDIPMYEAMKGRMSSRQTIPFFGLFVKHFKKSCIYALTCLLVKFPVTLAIFAATYYAAAFLVAELGLFAIFFVTVFVILIFSLRSTMFSLCVAHVSYSEKTFRPFFEAIRLSFRKFGRIYGYTVSFLFVLLFFNVAFAFFTFGPGIILSAPFSVLFYAIFQLVLYFSIRHFNYYLYDGSIVRGKLDGDFPELEEMEEMKRLEEDDGNRE